MWVCYQTVGGYLSEELPQSVHSERQFTLLKTLFYDQICLCTSQLWCVEILEVCPMEAIGSSATELEVKSLTTVTAGTPYLEMRRGLVREMDREPHGVDPLLAVNVS